MEAVKNAAQVVISSESARVSVKIPKGVKVETFTGMLRRRLNLIYGVGMVGIYQDPHRKQNWLYIIKPDGITKSESDWIKG